jgi:hypothetical protein
MAQDWCVANLPESWSTEACLAQQPRLHCNRLDYYQNSDNTTALLLVKITEVMANLPRGTIAKACERFWLHIKAVVEASEDLFL